MPVVGTFSFIVKVYVRFAVDCAAYSTSVLCILITFVNLLLLIHCMQPSEFQFWQQN